MAAVGQRSPKLTTIIDAAVKYCQILLFSLFILFQSHWKMSKEQTLKPNGTRHWQYFTENNPE